MLTSILTNFLSGGRNSQLSITIDQRDKVQLKPHRMTHKFDKI